MLRRWVLALVLLAVAGTARESLGGLVVVTDGRYVQLPGESPTTPDPGESIFDVSLQSSSLTAQVQQNTTLTADFFTGSGTAVVADPTDLLSVHSIFDVVFQVTGPVSYLLQGYFNTTPLVQPNPGDALVGSFSSSLGENIALGEPTPTVGYELFSVPVHLVPGVDYRLLFSVSEIPLGQGEGGVWYFTLALPEPALPLQVLAGLALLFGRILVSRAR